jgi:hypothetical protein
VYQQAVAQDYFNAQTDPQSGQPVQGWRPTGRSQYVQQQKRANQNQNNNSYVVTGQGNQRLRGSVDQGYSPGGYVPQYGKPAMVTPMNQRDNPESVYHGKTSQIPRQRRQLPLGVPIQGTNSMGSGPQLNGSANKNPPAARGGQHQATFNLRILVPNAQNIMQPGKYHDVTVTYPGRHPRIAGDNGVGPMNSTWVDVDVVDHTKGVKPITGMQTSFSRTVGNRAMIETIFVDKAWTDEQRFRAGVTGQFTYN